MTKAKTYKGLDLLEKVFEFIAMTPDANQWHVSSLKENPSRQIRLRQIQSLINAFLQQETNANFFDKTMAFFQRDKNSLGISSVLSGDFIKNRGVEDYAKLIDLMQEIVSQKEGELQEERPIHIMQLVMPYQRLVQYKRQLFELSMFNSGWFEISTFASRFSIYLTNEIIRNLEGRYSALDSVLELFINPKGLTFTEEELIGKYKFPTESPQEFDIDNM
jgi:hypothetical protein